MSDNITKRVGLGTAYGFAKAGGYEGTVAEFTELLGNIAIDLARIENLSVTVTTLPAGSQATASLNGSVLSLGIPKGDKGDKGNTGDTGASAGFGTVSATVDDNIGTPSVEVTASGADTAKNFAFSFHNLKGQKGDKGDTGEVTLSQLEDFTVVQTDENAEPYNFRATPKCGHIERLKKVVGVSVAFNQLVGVRSSAYNKTENGITFTDNRDGTYTVSGTATGNAYLSMWDTPAIISGHKYFYSSAPSGGSTSTYYAYCTGNIIGANDTGNGCINSASASGMTNVVFAYIKSGTTINNLKFIPQLTDLTLALGSTIADYVYSLEQATAGSGVAWLKQHFPKMFAQYNAYDAGSIRSVEGLSAHITKDADENVLGSYPLDNSLTLRGMLKISNGNLYAGGDEYETDGTVNRKWAEVDLGSLDWQKSPAGNKFYATVSPAYPNVDNLVMICARYAFDGAGSSGGGYYGDDKTIRYYYATAPAYEIYIHDEAYSDATAFKTAMNGVMLVYELATPTTESADPYTENQICEAGGTEEFVSTSIVPIGHETEYPLTLADTVPTANGNYVLKCTVSNGKASYEWVSA